MIHCDAIIVGGGPAGSSCARDLSRAGADVVVLDRARFPRDKCCAGWITPAVVATLALDLDEYRARHTLQAITGFRTSAIGRPPVTTDYARPVSYAIRRCEFDSFLLQRSGARLETGVPVRRIGRRNGREDGCDARGAGLEADDRHDVRGVGLQADARWTRDDLWIVDDRFAAPVLVGAGGHFCPVARRLNPRSGKQEAGSGNGRPGARHPEDLVDGPVVVAREVEFRMSGEQARRCPVRGELPELFFCPDRRGYGWCVRKDDYLNVGFGRLGGADFNEQARQAVGQFAAAGRIPDDLPDRWVGHAYRIYARPQRTCVSDGVLLAGDAAGLAHPVSGEGILRAIESGRLAARAILEARGDYRAETLASYSRALAARYGRPNGVASGEPTLASALASRVGVWLMSTRWFSRRVLLDRWFLHVNAPPLAI